jgi:outer membrane protein assembly factor BamB
MSTQPILVVAFGGNLLGVDPATGKVVWERDVGAHTPRVIVTDAYVFVAGLRLACFAYPTGEPVWENRAYTDRAASVILSDERLFCGSNGEVACYSARDGQLLWKNKFPGKGSAEVALATPTAAMQAARQP